MKEKHMNLFFPQWQGAGKTDELMKGALEIREKYIKNHDFFEIPVKRGENKKIENNILGYAEIVEQLKLANALIAAEDPDRIFSVGRGCDIELQPVSHLNRKRLTSRKTKSI